jgi:hypothetical protein
MTIILMQLVLSSCATMESVHPLPLPLPEKKVRPEGPLPPSTRPTYNLTGYPDAVKEGYIDGCETAKDTPYGFKDEGRYDFDGQYKMGWDDGFSLCQTKTD